MAKKNARIRVQTLPNGYSLEFDGMKQPFGHMYFTVKDLLRGFFIHIGLGMTEELETDKMEDLLEAARTWKNNKACIKDLKRLKKELQESEMKCSRLARQLIAERDQRISFFVDVQRSIKVFEDYSDQNVKKQFKKIIRSRKRPDPLTYKDLGAKALAKDDEDDED